LDEETKPPFPRASFVLWLAVLLTVVALWFVDALLKPTGPQRNFRRK